MINGARSWFFATGRRAAAVCRGGALALLLGVAGQADTWQLKTGERVVGRLIKENARFLIVESPALGRLKVPREQIKQWEHESPPPAAAASSSSSASGKLNWPPTDGFDWLELKSGEWLRGRVRSIQNRKLEFDSDELDEQSFDLKDIRQLVSPHPNFLLFNDKTTAVGPVKISPREVSVQGKRPVTLPRGELRGLSPGRPREINYWSGKLSLGLSVRAGNTEQADLNAKAGLQRRTPASRLSFDYLGNFSQLQGETSANNHRVSSACDVLLTRRLYLRPIFAQFYRDPFQNLSRQITVGAGAGYLLWDTSRTEWDLFGGPACQMTRFMTIESGGRLNDSTPAFLLGTQFDTELSRRIDLLLAYQAIATSPEAGTVTLHFVNTLEVELTRVLNLDVSLVWDRIQTPRTDVAGETPKRDDLRLTVGIGVDF
jgi:hypothetical protein